MSGATERALARVLAGESGYAAAVAEGISFSTLYRNGRYRAAVNARDGVTTITPVGSAPTPAPRARKTAKKAKKKAPPAR